MTMIIIAVGNNNHCHSINAKQLYDVKNKNELILLNLKSLVNRGLIYIFQFKNHIHIILFPKG